MKVRDLICELTELPMEATVYLSSDDEGNSYRQSDLPVLRYIPNSEKDEYMPSDVFSYDDAVDDDLDHFTKIVIL